MVTREAFHAAYDAWKSASDEHKLRMEATKQGLPLDVDRMNQRLAEIERLHEDWMRKAEPFVIRKPKE
ncbi:hypothetical protein RCH10_005071 [Variovorax sp. GrIS 2.14]|uniref:hypothetical protein n=1 Tax=Variovorax sp. GrIS 2.14 TaxID=3071709 RepID=UPI0038F61954